MTETFSSTQSAKVIEAVTGKSFSDGKIRVWKQRGQIPYIGEGEGVRAEQMHQLALQAKLVDIGIAPQVAGYVAAGLGRIASAEEWLSVGWFPNGQIGIVSTLGLGAIESPAAWGEVGAQRYEINADGSFKSVFKRAKDIPETIMSINLDSIERRVSQALEEIRQEEER